ncbi:hypothetical protein SPI_06398 [Niveomyces insectorum RCEF 264]|uniref:Uncharacterized protein n=1 Tax=Niveomyces insectorum RCEF 264 TaxID=1081102 RepID=A0A167S3K0_9HYPO|nr:hypothetical protein SPI_06398 [Niveomyces insectorum RCEF 264]
MSGAPEAAVEKHTAHHQSKRCAPSRQLYYNRLSRAILNTSNRLNELARLGRPGQWILHHEEIYEAALDTRPQSRNPDEEVPVHGLTYCKVPLRDWGLIWAGKGPAPDFQDVAFWEDKVKGLDDKIELVKARLVRPRFTPEELQTLESLEQQPRHFFHIELNSKRKRMGGVKNGVFNVLFSLARLGRPGQWILHNEELYHPTIDTRPQTRAAEKSIVVRDSHYKGDTRVTGDGILVDFKLTWAGNGPPPDFDDFHFWEYKLSDLRDKRRQVEEGRVEPRFTPDELQTLEALENDKDHAFAQFLKDRKEKPPVVVETEEEVAASRKLALARELVVSVMGLLWYDGLAGKWVLHCEHLYLPEYDTHFRERYKDEDGDIFQENVLVDSFNGLRFDTRFGPPPDFSDITYWERKRAELRKKEDEVEAGRLTAHNFTEAELMRIELLERAISEQREKELDGHSGSTDQRTKQIAAWLDGNTEETMPTPQKPRIQTPPPPTHPPSGHTGRRDHTTKDVGDEHSQPRRSGALKRRRPTNNDDESLPGHAIHPVKRSKMQPPPEPLSTTPTQRHVSRQQPSSPLQKVRGHPQTARTAPSAPLLDPSNPGAKTDGHQLAGRGTRRSMNVSQRGSGAADRRTQRLARAGLGAGRHLRRRGGSPADPPLRRSARIAALPPRKNLYR